MHASRRVWLVLAVAAASNVAAQTATFRGVARDSSRTRLSGVEVAIASLRRAITTNDSGEFQMAGLAAGRYEISIRRVGLRPLTDTVELADGATVERTYVMHQSIPMLDSVRTVDAGRRTYISPGLNAFEERRKLGFGHFIPDSVIRQNENRQVSSLLRLLPGANIVPYRSSAFVGSSRSMSGGASAKAVPGDPGSPRGCWATVYLDGGLIYSVVQGQRGSPAPDFNNFNATDLAGIEFYAGSSSVPVEYNSTEYGCGTLLLWTRER